VRKTDFCWIWKGEVDRLGYGRLGIAGRVCLVHRLAYLLKYNEPSLKTSVVHTCGNRLCVRPDHVVGTSKMVADVMTRCVVCGALKDNSKLYCSNLCRFILQVDITPTCWLWEGEIDETGLGIFRAKKQKLLAYEFLYSARSPIPEGHILIQKCGNKLCVRPDHVDLVRSVFPRSIEREVIKTVRSKGRLSVDEVRNIRLDISTGKYSQIELGVKYNVSQPYISYLARRKRGIDSISLGKPPDE
jgi:hypothetical protein